MKRMSRLRWCLEIIIRASTVLELIWIGHFMILTTSLATDISLVIFFAALFSIPLIQKLQKKWPAIYHVIAMGILVGGIWALTGFPLLLGCVLVVIAILGSLPQTAYGWLMLLYPVACYFAGYFLNAVPIRLLALLIALLMLISHQLMTWMTEMTAAQALSKAVAGHTDGGFLSISRKQLLLMLSGLAISGLSFMALLAWLQPFGTFVYTPKEIQPPKQTIQSQGPTLPKSPNPSQALEEIVGKSEPNQLLVKFWEIFEHVLQILLVIAGLFLLFYIGYQMLHYLRVKQPQEEAEELPEIADFVLLDQKTNNRASHFPLFSDYNQRVRQRFKKEFRHPSQVSATPRELAATLEDTPYTQLLLVLYEKARYNEEAVTKEDWQALKVAKKAHR